jgi:Fe-S-cluster formation regulator IscX/YfhJ
MSRLDHHVAAVQTKLALRRFGYLFARTTFILGLLVLLAVLVDKLSQTIPANLRDRYRLVILIGIGVCAGISAIWAGLTRPSREQAAAAIDEKLRLKEKFSTAIYVRPSSDPFAMAAVKDAERTAENVQLGKQFPVPYPRMAWGTKAVFAAALAAAYFMPTLSLFGQRNNVAKKPEAEAVQQAAKEAVARAIAAVDAMPKSSQNTDEFRKLVAELHEFNKAPKLDDPNRANRRALQALQEVNNQTAKEWDKAKKYAEAQNSLMQSLQPPDDAKGPVGEARKEIAKGNFDQASAKLEDAVKNFDKMDQKSKEDAAKQMEQAAKQLQQLAQNPQVQQQIQQQLQQMGANQAQAQKMQQLMQQAAAGNQQAAQQLQQAAQQMAQQMNNGQGPNAQQQQQIQQAMQQMQAQANAQNQANGLAQAAQQMAQAMQAQQNQQAGGQQNPQQGQQMQQAQQQMKQALQNMQGVKQDLKQMAQQQQQAQQAMQQGQQNANGQCNNPGQGQGQNPNQAAGQGQFKQGNPQNQGNGMGGPGIGQGGQASKTVQPFGIKEEQSPSQDDENGKILASYLVKDKAEPGVQKMMMQKMVAKAEKEATDEVDSEHANRAAQKVAQEYFRTMSKDTPEKK